jgi:hypothetical protein
MVFLSALQDFVVRTLGSFSGALAKLVYIGELRRDGDYEHWGLSRAHGEAAAKRAISDAHTQVWLEVLRTPLAKLSGEMRSLFNEDAAGDAVAGWRARPGKLIPPDTSGGSKRHFNSILLALSLLARAGKGSSRRVS